MTAPCTRPECGGEVHTDGWGNPIQCPALYEPNAIICPLVYRTPHDAHEHEGLRCPGWGPDDGTSPEEPPHGTPLEEAQATVESLRYQIRRAREALGTDEAPASGLDQLRRDRDELRSLLYEVLGHFVHKGHPGEPCLSSGWISVRTVQRWQEALNKAVDAASKETEA